MSAEPDYAAQEREMRECGDLRLCQWCDATVPYLFTKRSWPGFEARCGMWTVRPQVCPEGYCSDRGPYPAGMLEAMDQAALFQEMDRAYARQARVVDNFGSDDASWRAESRCKVIEQEIKTRGWDDAYWGRSTPTGVTAP